MSLAVTVASIALPRFLEAQNPFNRRDCRPQLSHDSLSLIRVGLGRSEISVSPEPQILAMLLQLFDEFGNCFHGSIPENRGWCSSRAVRSGFACGLLMRRRAMSM